MQEMMLFRMHMKSSEAQGEPKANLLQPPSTKQSTPSGVKNESGHGGEPLETSLPHFFKAGMVILANTWMEFIIILLFAGSVLHRAEETHEHKNPRKQQARHSKARTAHGHKRRLWDDDECGPG